MNYIIVNGMEFAYTWQDFGTYRRLHVYQNDILLGKKDLPIPVDIGLGVIEYSVKSILRGQSEIKQASI